MSNTSHSDDAPGGNEAAKLATPQTLLDGGLKVAIDSYINERMTLVHEQEERVWRKTAQILGAGAAVGLGLVGWALLTVVNSAKDVARESAVSTTQSYLVSSEFIDHQIKTQEEIEEVTRAASTDAAVARLRVSDLNEDTARLKVLLDKTPGLLTTLQDVKTAVAGIAHDKDLQEKVADEVKSDFDTRIARLEDYAHKHDDILITSNATLCPNDVWASTMMPVWVRAKELSKFQPSLTVDPDPAFYSGTHNGDWGIAYLALCMRRK